VLTSLSCHVIVFCNHLAHSSCKCITVVTSVGLALDVSLAVRRLVLRSRSVIVAEHSSGDSFSIGSEGRLGWSFHGSMLG
jgi:hypothetical protein